AGPAGDPVAAIQGAAGARPAYWRQIYRAAHRVGELAREPGEPAHGPRHGQPPVAASFRPRPGADRQRLRRPRRTTHPPGAARLNARMGGPGVFPPIPVEAGVRAWKASADAADHTRRSVYISARRNLRFPFLEAFDLPDSNQSCPKRERSTTAPQALALLNSEDGIEAAKGLAERVKKEALTQQEQIALVYRLTLGRKPTATELATARAFLRDSP